MRDRGEVHFEGGVVFGFRSPLGLPLEVRLAIWLFFAATVLLSLQAPLPASFLGGVSCAVALGVLGCYLWITQPF